MKNVNFFFTVVCIIVGSFSITSCEKDEITITQSSEITSTPLHYMKPTILSNVIGDSVTIKVEMETKQQITKNAAGVAIDTLYLPKYALYLLTKEGENILLHGWCPGTATTPCYRRFRVSVDDGIGTNTDQDNTTMEEQFSIESLL